MTLQEKIDAKAAEVKEAREVFGNGERMNAIEEIALAILDLFAELANNDKPIQVVEVHKNKEMLGAFWVCACTDSKEIYAYSMDEEKISNKIRRMETLGLKGKELTCVKMLLKKHCNFGELENGCSFEFRD